SQPEPIVGEVTIERPKRLTLKLGRCVLGNTDHAPEEPTIRGTYLKRIAIDEFDDGLGRYENVLLVDVANDVAVLVDRLEGDRGVQSRMSEKPPVRIGVILLALGDTIEVVDLLESRNLGHHDSYDRTAGGRVQG